MEDNKEIEVWNPLIQDSWPNYQEYWKYNKENSVPSEATIEPCPN